MNAREEHEELAKVSRAKAQGLFKFFRRKNRKQAWRGQGNAQKGSTQMSGNIYHWVADWNLSASQAALLLHGPSAEMVDCLGDNARHVIISVYPHIRRFGGYITGSGGIAWSAEDFASVPKDCAVWSIDQSNGDLPLLSDVKKVVKDVESGASTIAECVKVAKQRLAHGDDYIIYSDRAILQELEDALAAAGLPRGQIIAFQFASPSSNPHTPVFPGGPNLQTLNADLSVVLTAFMPLPGAPKAASDVAMRATVRAPVGAGGTGAIVTFDPDTRSWDIHTLSDHHGWQVKPAPFGPP